MMQLPNFIKQLTKPEYPYQFSICTLVTRRDEYLQMLDTFIEAGFDKETCEYLLIDNSQANLFDAYDGINRFLQEAKGEYLIICHQDILLTATSTRQILEQRIGEMNAADSAWAILSNAGAADRLYDRLAIKIAYPSGFVDLKGQLPQKVGSVDENFILVKNRANLALSCDIGGYHLYGLDLCMAAKLAGYSAWVIDFLIVHKSTGNADGSFDDALKRVKAKYTDFLKGRYKNTTIARFYLSGSKLQNWMFNTRVFRRVIKTSEEIKTKLSR